MNSYETHAWREFKASGWLDESGKFTDDMQKSICDHVIKLLGVFAGEGHSGTTAPYAINLFEKLAKFEPIAPLTGEDWEWNVISDDRTDGITVYQNNRCSHVFKQANRFDGQAYDIDGIVWWNWYEDPVTGEKFKTYFTNNDSFVPIEFPYTPKQEVLYCDKEDE